MEYVRAQPLNLGCHSGRRRPWTLEDFGLVRIMEGALKGPGIRPEVGENLMLHEWTIQPRGQVRPLSYRIASRYRQF